MARRVVACVILSAVLAAGCGGTTHHAPPAAPHRAQLTPQLARALGAELRSVYADAGIAGVSAAIVFPDGREWSDATGLAVVHPRQPMTPRTSLPFDSITKIATAALALRYAEEGRLRLDDPIKRWYPAWNGDPRATVRDLLGHVSGARDARDSFFTWVSRHPEASVTARQMIAATPRPGPRTEETVYSNTGFAIAGLILQRAGREPVAAGMRRELFGAPGGAGLALQPSARAHAPHAHSYWYPNGLGGGQVDRTDDSGLLPFHSWAEMASTAGGLAGDDPSLARWGQALLGGHLLKPASLREMTRFHGDSIWQGYGLGLARDTVDGHLMWGHTGGGSGSHTELWYLPGDHLTIAVSWNDDSLDSNDSLFLSHLLRTVWASEKRA